MSTLIQIAHPNELIWRTVEEIPASSSIQDHLASPTYEIYDTLCVRVIDSEDEQVFYTGIYNATECVDVGPYSDVMSAYSFEYHDGAERFARSMPSWIECWRLNPYPESIMHAIYFMFSSMRLAKVLCVCIRDAMETMDVNIGLSEKAYAVVIAVEDWSNEKIQSADVYSKLFAFSDLFSTTSRDDMPFGSQTIMYGIIYLGQFVTRQGKEQQLMRVMESCIGSRATGPNDFETFDDRRMEIANIIRGHIPFHEIAERITR